ncbi:uncharacterized protein LOC144663867 isoform X2 [Oculina patagonica]
MADEEELYFANLDEFVNDEDKIVTYKWLSRTLSVPANKAKQMLYAFVQKQKAAKSASHLNITYIIGGRSSVDGEIVQRYVITQDENLEETKKTFSPVTSLHIYSIQKCKLKDSNSLYTVDYDIQQQHNNENNRWSHIHCAAAVPLADKGVNRGAHRMNGLTNGDKCPTTKMVNGTAEPGTSHKGSSNLATEQKAKMPASKAKKGQMSALEMFAAKPSTTKTEKSNSEKHQDTKDVKGDESKAGQAKMDSNKAGSMKSFFGKPTTVKKAPEKPAATENKKEEAISKPKTETVPKKQNQTVESVNKKKRELSSEDEEEEPLPSKISKAIKSDSTEKKVVKGDKKKQQKKEEKQTEAPKSKAGKKKAVIKESDEEAEEKPKKKRKRTKELPKEDSSDDEQVVTNAKSDTKVPSDQGSSRSESPLPQQQPRQTENDTTRRRKRKRQLKSKTYMNDEGFMVTEKVWESESTDASDEELQITSPPVKEKKPSPAKKPNKKTHADMKNKSAKQASLTSFFKKS